MAALSSQQPVTSALDSKGHPNRTKRPRPSDSPQSTDVASEMPMMEVQIGCSFVVVECGGRSSKLYLDKFYKLPGNKGYEKCIAYNDNILVPQEFESVCGMKAMKAWKKSIHHI